MRNLRKIEKPLALLSFLCLFPAGMSAQSIVKGVVTDPSGEPVIGATVKAAGSKLGVITDLDGKFSLSVQKGATLVISYIGYVTQEIPVENETELKVILKKTPKHWKKLL